MGWNFFDTLENTVSNTFDTVGGIFSSDKRKRQKGLLALVTGGASVATENAAEAFRDISQPIMNSSLVEGMMPQQQGLPELTTPQIEATTEVFDPRKRNQRSTMNSSTLTGQYDSQPSLIG